MGGQGFALGWIRMLGDQLKNRQLIAPLSEQVETDDKYYLAYPCHKSPQWDFSPFHDWLIAEFGQPTRAVPTPEAQHEPHPFLKLLDFSHAKSANQSF